MFIVLCRFMTAPWVALWMDRDKQVEAVHVAPKNADVDGLGGPDHKGTWCMGWGGLETDTCWDVIGAGYGGKAQTSVCKAPPKPPDKYDEVPGTYRKGLLGWSFTHAQATISRLHSRGLIQCRPAMWHFLKFFFFVVWRCYIGIKVIAQRNSTVVMPPVHLTSA